MGYTSCFFVVFNILAASHQKTELLRFFKPSFRESSFLLYLCFYVFLHDPQVVVVEGADGERDAVDQLHDGHLQHERLPLQEGADDVDQKPER